MKNTALLVPVILLSAVFTLLITQNISADERPNVVMIISDDQAWTDYGFMGHDEIETPCLDQLAAESATYMRGYVPTALCRPSLATMATGRYAHEHLICGNDPTPANNPALRQQVIDHIDAFPTLPKLLGKAGYVSLQTGKWWEGDPTEHGFTEGMTRGFPKPGGRHGDDGLKIGREGIQPIPSFIDRAVEENKPFFLWYAPFLPHAPHTPPADILAKYEKDGRPIELAKYYAMCEWFDITCRQVLNCIEEAGVADNTIVIYVCDNGWIQRVPDTETPEGWKSGFAPRSKQSAYEGGIRTPIMVKWPSGGVKPKIDRDTLVSSIDLAPTILQACGVKAPEGLPGISLLADACGEKPLPRDTIFGEQFAHDIADIDRPEASLRCRWVIEGPWKLMLNYDGKLGHYGIIHQSDPVEPKLFNLTVDPNEANNVAAANPELVRRLAEKIEKWNPLSDDAPQLLSELP